MSAPGANKKVRISPTTELEMSVSYPGENPKGYAEDIANTLAYMGVFDGL